MKVKMGMCGWETQDKKRQNAYVTKVEACREESGMGVIAPPQRQT
jgi:hypothetical protein